jgi:hypothetical protein
VIDAGALLAITIIPNNTKLDVASLGKSITNTSGKLEYFCGIKLYTI